MINSEIRKTIIANATPDKIFSAISNENELSKWWVDIPKLELKLGGKLSFRFLKENSEQLKKDYIVKGKVIELILNKKLVYSWKPIDEPEFSDSLVTWELEEFDSSKTKVKVIHSGLENCKSFEKLDAGWTFFLNKLEKLY